ncbi:uncharacterized protein LOC111628194 [Centruroides sculpturatus]|uniref:uncharacterized protein LOC111628194 n=2 Tax=Centruroides sculpturatus TaxID=218467 RepID=UPI000C6E255D|nr:uncharacterized protein LOC111628194 [Centruroides sculpturatus]
MSLNIMKSKVVVFRNGGKLAKLDKWWFRNDVIQIVSQYKYLGVVFRFNGKFKYHIQTVKKNAFVKTDKVIQMCRSAKLRNLKDCLRIFNSIVKSSMLYASEVWGYQYDELDPVLVNFIKKLFGLSRCTPNYLIFMECSLLPLSFTLLNKCLNWTFRTIALDEKRWSRICLCYVLNKKDFLWSKSLREICVNNGINFEELLNKHDSCSILKLNYFDNFILDLNQRVNASSYNDWYKHLNKSFFDCPLYNNNFSFNIGATVMQIRCNSLNFLQNYRREICMYCKDDQLLDAFHVIAKCSKLEKIRESVFGTSIIPLENFLELITNIMIPCTE